MLLLVYGIKSSLKFDDEFGYTFVIVLMGIIALIIFVRQELKSPNPMINFQLFKIKVLVVGIIIAIVAMVTLVGFELLMAQELQLVYDFTPLNAGLFIAPLMLSSCLGGPIAGWLASRVSLRILASAGIGFSSLCFLGLFFVDFTTQTYSVWAIFILLGLSLDIALLASTSAIMSSVTTEQATAAGAIENMAYELGAGFGVIIFGLMIGMIYSYSIDLPTGLPVDIQHQIQSSITQAFKVASYVDSVSLSNEIITEAKLAFSSAHKAILIAAASLLLILALFIWHALSQSVHQSNGIQIKQ